LLSENLSGISRPHVFFTLGKGGVGKSTIAISLALELSRKGRTLLASFDPAKHLLKYLGVPEPGRIHSVGAFDAYQLDLEQATRRLAEELEGNLEYLAPSLKVLNAEKVLSVARYTPGLEEDSIIRELSRIYGLTGYDYIVVDMPPTGLSLRVLVLPELYVSWLNGLIDLRLRILSLKYTVEKVKGRSRDIRDPVLDKLVELRDTYLGLSTSLKNQDKTSYIIVANPEPLPFYEVKEIIKTLKEVHGVNPRLLVMNKIPGDKLTSESEVFDIISEYCEIPVHHICIPLLNKPPSSLHDVEALTRTIYDCCKCLAEHQC
jgi:arsenite-transporting ATPase